MSRNKIQIPVGSNMVLVYRNVGNVILVNKSVTDDYQEPQVLATSAAGCNALGDAFKEMATAIRDLKKSQGD